MSPWIRHRPESVDYGRCSAYRLIEGTPAWIGAALASHREIVAPFYEQFGDEVTNELVNWFNAVDETYRNQLRELNELNWERFRSELRAEGAAIRADVEMRLAGMEKRFDGRFGAVETRLAAIDTILAGVNDRFPAFEQRLEARFDAKSAAFETRMFKAMFWFWTATIIPLGALIVTLSEAFRR